MVLLLIRPRTLVLLFSPITKNMELWIDSSSLQILTMEILPKKKIA